MTEANKPTSIGKRSNLTMWAFLVFIAYFLITEHWAHIVPFLPWLILLACPLMHIFMHGGHDHGSGHGSHDDHETHESHSHNQEK
jgi:hypothetical protein